MEILSLRNVVDESVFFSIAVKRFSAAWQQTRDMYFVSHYEWMVQSTVIRCVHNGRRQGNECLLTYYLTTWCLSNKWSC